MPCDDIITQSTVAYEVPVAVSEPLPEVEPDKVEENIAVSYTHLTLPTIYSV